MVGPKENGGLYKSYFGQVATHCKTATFFRPKVCKYSCYPSSQSASVVKLTSFRGPQTRKEDACKVQGEWRAFWHSLSLDCVIFTIIFNNLPCPTYLYWTPQTPMDSSGLQWTLVDYQPKKVISCIIFYWSPLESTGLC
jgi:hypothetical protein